ncbi:MAG: hypothetical protein CO099_06125 [Bdellovibrio sp. CG_4_9_14_3_um_filter_39_7]|nr:MAG: hypothetical protein CO099_06125 [Bdellovibrio sp. CG_4_9_14_3_um_filter_39_7]
MKETHYLITSEGIEGYRLIPELLVNKVKYTTQIIGCEEAFSLKKERDELRAENNRNISNLDNLIRIQEECIEDDYMQGLYNGLALAFSVLTAVEPQYLTHDKIKKYCGAPAILKPLSEQIECEVSE